MGSEWGCIDLMIETSNGDVDLIGAFVVIILSGRPVRRLANLGIHMQKRCLKNVSSSAVALIVLVGWSSIASAQWTPLANAFPSGFAEGCLLLTDGTVMCHEYGTNRWHRLKPDINGSYQNGSWDVPGFTIAAMPNGNDPTIGCVNCPYTPLYFASAVLPDGRVVVIGGEYNGGAPVWTNIGFMYDPVANTWSAQITVPGTWCCAGGGGTGAIGDAESTILTNGTMLVANIGTRDIASFNPATLTFSALAPTDKDDINDEEGWYQLANGTFLTVDSRIQASFEIYDSATNSWGTAGSTVVNLADTGSGTVNSKEVGPAVLRPDGTLIAFSGTNSGQNAVYNTATGTWAATGVAGNFPAGPGASHFAVADGPASLLPNGNVLVMASPVYPTNPPGVFNPPSHFFEFDGTNLTQVADSPNAASFISYQGRMLLLPSGEVLLTAYNQGGNQLLRPNARTNSPIKTPAVPLVDVARMSCSTRTAERPRTSGGRSSRQLLQLSFPAIPTRSQARCSTVSRKEPRTATMPRCRRTIRWCASGTMQLDTSFTPALITTAGWASKRSAAARS